MIDNYDDSHESSIEPSPLNLARCLEEQYLGDERFESIEILEPGPLEGETVRVKYICNAATQFMVAILEDESIVRVGLATKDQEVSGAIEEAANDTGDSLTEFLEDLMDAEDELEYEVRHFHDDIYYFVSDLPYQRDEDLVSERMRDEIIYYLDGYMAALFDYIETKEE